MGARGRRIELPLRSLGRMLEGHPAKIRTGTDQRRATESFQLPTGRRRMYQQVNIQY